MQIKPSNSVRKIQLKWKSNWGLFYNLILNKSQSILAFRAALTVALKKACLKFNVLEQEWILVLCNVNFGIKRISM